ncbi:NAD-dependent epimerase/dehydratase family protein [Heyndrickxia oleronia]|uniref:NAD-dependent epimerase/dehydratase family protein n=1 Tax=Heyndrickxia oleronia TaxID=38875 RepID=UPI00242B85C9|nr:NAD-dependent epimerase/dehydratase family protein [Heyndrickxia oleronia]MCI1593400.1 NAD-dependent epimerase/dehydratase family protein [Heyndrickxia oleronia]MCI1746504.1 NAD-dependent epimerase/dehydratase family protein [Heyndrickxia oleronia]MCI1764293.1 NAD-dependent epimerase/dehydratase family protein [Heyndrickxia oleronia]
MDKIKNSKILITGGAGFIGSNLADALIEDNEIVIVDDLSMGKIENLPQSTHLHFFEHSITDEEFMNRLLLNWKFDYIFLLAAVASVADTIARPLETHEINQNANLNILETIRIKKLDVKKVLFTSSAAVYGNNPQLPKEEISPIEPLSPYAIDKFATEKFVVDYGKLYNIPTVCTRFFNVYGPKQNPESPYSGVLSLICEAAQNNLPFTVFGDGTQTRDFVYIDDVVQALLILAGTNKFRATVYNVATGVPTSLNEVIHKLQQISQSNFKITYMPSRKGDITASYANIQKIQETGYKVGYSLEKGLKKYWQSLDRK